MRTKVLHVVGNLELGGGQKLAALVALALDRREFDVAVLSLGSSDAYGPRLAENGVPVTSLGLVQPIHRNSPLALLRALRALIGILRSGRWDVVHTHMFSSAVVVAPLARLFGARVFGTAHRIYYGRVQPRLERLLALLNERIVVDSNSVLEILRARTKVPREKYAVIYNCVDTEQFQGSPDAASARVELGLRPEDLVVTEIAHLRKHKGQMHLVRAASRIYRDAPDLVVLLVGGGPDEAVLRSEVASLGFSGRVRFLGPRSDLGTILAATDVLALPSEYEGFGIVQAEAMHFSIPVVATSYGGSTEVVVDGETGFLVPFGDVNALEDKLGRLVHDGELRGQLGRAGRIRSEQLFGMSKLGEAYAALYRGRDSHAR